MNNNYISVIGIGYIGLPLSLFLAKAGFKVLGVDTDQNKVSNLKNGIINIEDEINDMFSDPVVKNNFLPSTTLEESDVYIICVPTPIKNEKADLSYLKVAVESILPYLQKGNMVIIESTIPPNTCNNIIKPLISDFTGFKIPEEFGIVHCPERVIPGNLAEEFPQNARIIGGMSEKWTNKAAQIYGKFVTGEITKTDTITAELVKLVENAYRDVNIAFANQIKIISDQLDVNINELINLANLHPRVNVLKPGIGVGGHCIPVDPKFLIEQFPNDTPLLIAARSINDSMINKTSEYIIKQFQKLPEQLTIIGKSYKQNVMDDRESPALKIVDILQSKNIKIKLYDPFFEDYKYESIVEISENSDGLVILVPHDIVLEEYAEKKHNIHNVLKGEKIVLLFK